MLVFVSQGELYLEVYILKNTLTFYYFFCILKSKSTREEKYMKYVEAGQLRLMKTAQFFRIILNEKKQQFNLLKHGREI